MLDKLKSLFKKSKPVVEKPPVEKKPRKPRKPREEKPVSEKDRATAAGEPYVSITKVDVDPANINSGSFELDWNDKFLLNLIKNGYKQRPDDTDNIIVDRWFQTVCRNIALEVYEQQQADPLNREDDDLRRINRKDLGNGRSEIS
jgi:hypothetical protein